MFFAPITNLTSKGTKIGQGGVPGGGAISIFASDKLILRTGEVPLTQMYVKIGQYHFICAAHMVWNAL